MSQITITKGRFLKNDKIAIEYLKEDGNESKPAECSEMHSSLTHKDLKKAFQCLAIHAALIGEYVSHLSVKNINKPDPDLVKDFIVFGFSIVEDGVILYARKTLKMGEAMSFNTPVIKLEDKSEDAYPFTKNLAICIDACKDELTKYLDGKFAPDPQIVLFPDEKTHKRNNHIPA